MSRRIPFWLPVVVIFVAFLLVWQGVVSILQVSPFLLPPPTDVGRSLMEVANNPFQSNGYALQTWSTFSAALLGFGIASCLGVGLAVVLSWVPILQRLVMPYIVGFQVLPRLAIAPLFIIWFGHGIPSKVLLATMAALFPILINTLAGLKAADSSGVELMQSLRASRLQTFRYFLFPSSLPYVFAGLEVGLVFALLGVIVAEFVGGNTGLGVMILQFHYDVDISGVFSVLVVLAAIGLLMRWAILRVRARVLFWLPGTDDEAVRQ